MKSIPKDHVYLPQYAITASLKQSLFGSGKKKSSETMKKYPLFVIFWECFTIDGVVQIQDNWWL